MPKKLTKSEICNLILEEDLKEDFDDEEIIHLLLQRSVTKNINKKNKESISFGGHVADKLAKVAGSWGFIFTFCAVLIAWIIVNSIFLTNPYDPFPFILLNLILSCIAAIQAPVIMMSQNRQEQKDRFRAENDYKVNLKSEVIIEDLHIKLDQLISNQEKILKDLENTKNTNK